jgi:hypothetical protein
MIWTSQSPLGHGLIRFIFVGWGVAQWIVLLPLILYQRAKGRPDTVRGLIVAGCLTLLLSSFCAALVSGSAANRGWLPD